MGMPPRAGRDWGEAIPGAVPPEGRPAKIPEQKLTGGGGGGLPPAPQGGPVPVKVVNACLDRLPFESISMFTRNMEMRYSWDITAAAGIGSNGRYDLHLFTVPKQYVYIITDLTYYVLAPSRSLEAPFTQLGEHAIAGIMHFELLLADKAAMSFFTSTYDGYKSSNTAVAAAQVTTGWSHLEKSFGPQRTIGFALYAKEDVQAHAFFVVDNLPRFNITKVGAICHGIKVPAGAFMNLFNKA